MASITKRNGYNNFEEQKNRGFLFRDFQFLFLPPKLIRLGPDEALFAAKEIVHGIDKGKPFKQQFYTLACYVRRNGKWVPRSYQNTPAE